MLKSRITHGPSRRETIVDRKNISFWSTRMIVRKIDHDPGADRSDEAHRVYLEGVYHTRPPREQTAGKCFIILSNISYGGREAAEKRDSPMFAAHGSSE